MTLTLRRSPGEIDRTLAAAAEAAPSYGQVGMTRGEPPEGYRVNRGRRVVGRGNEDMARGRAALRRWAMYDLPWTGIYPPDAPMEAGATAVTVARHFGLHSVNPVRIVYLEEEGDRLAVALGTLPGHAERGEERFEIRLDPGGEVVFEVRAYALLHHPLARVAAPLAGSVLRRFAEEAPRAVEWHLRARRVPGAFREGWVRSAAGHTLRTSVWDPEVPPRATVALVHGIGEHAMRHLETVTHLVGRGFRVAAVDLPGHGRSPGRRGDVRGWGDFREAAGALLRAAAREGGGRPLFLLGHSLGGLVVLDLLLHGPRGVDAAVVLGPPVGRTGLPPSKRLLAHTMGRLAPGITLSTGLDLGNLAHDGQVAEDFRADPWSHGLGSPRLELSRARVARAVLEGAGRIDLPVLLVHGTGDTLSDIGGSRALAARSPRITLREVEGGFHELHHDTAASATLAAIGDWLEARAGG